MKRSTILQLMLGSFLVAGQPPNSSAQAHAPAKLTQALPQVIGPIAVTATSRPFLGASARLAAAGYVEEEYFLSGNASTYDWTGHGLEVKPIAGPTQYVTRILVRRPRDAARFSGNVEVLILNASAGMDVGGAADFKRMVAQGDVWIGITTKALTVNALKKFDPVRYSPLNWSNPADPASRCAQPSIIPAYMLGGQQVIAMMAEMGVQNSAPETEDGLVWDMLGQLGLLLKSDQRHSILPGFSKPWVYMTGYSQSSIYMRTWIGASHDRFRTPDGNPLYDGYLGVVGPALMRINQCAADIALDDPRQKLAVPEVPFISLSSEGEMWLARYTHQPDAFSAKGGIVSYEVAGASHKRVEIPGVPVDPTINPSPEDAARAGQPMPATAGAPHPSPAGEVPNDLTWAPIVRGAYHNLQLWVRQGIKPPQSPGIGVDANHEASRDQNGNAIGGVRTPYIEAPVSAHKGYLTAGGIGGTSGTRKPYSPETLKAMYPTHAAYVAKFSAATDKLLAGRWISLEDAGAMKAAAQAEPIPQ